MSAPFSSFSSRQGADVCCCWQALAQLKRSTEVAWHEQLYGKAAVIREKQRARRLALEQEELDVRSLGVACALRDACMARMQTLCWTGGHASLSELRREFRDPEFPLAIT